MNTSENAVRRIPKRHVVGYGIGMYAVNSTFAMVVLYLAYFYTDVFLLPPAVMAILFMACRIWDGVNDPIMGLIADSTNSRWGRFRPYLLFTPFPMVIFGTLTYYVPDMSLTGKIIWAFATYIPLQMVKTAMAVPYFSMLPIMTTDAKERTVISSFQQVVTPLAFLGASIFVLKIVGMFPSEQEGFFYAALMFSSIAAVVMWITFFSTSRYDYPGNPLFQRESQQNKVLFKEKLKVVTKNRPLIIVISSFFAMNMWNAVTMGIMIYFFKYNLDMFDYYPVFMGLGVLTSMLGAAVTPMFVGRLGKKNLLQLSNLVYLAIGLAIVTLSYGQDQATLRELWLPGRICFLLAVLTNPFAIMAGVVLGALIPDCVEYAEWKTGLRAEGFINSLYLMANKAGMALGGAVIGIGLSLIDYEPNLPAYSEKTLTGILFLFFVVPGIFRIAMSVLMFFHNLPESRFRVIVEELRMKRDAAGAV